MGLFVISSGLDQRKHVSSSLPFISIFVSFFLPLLKNHRQTRCPRHKNSNRSASPPPSPLIRSIVGDDEPMATEPLFVQMIDFYSTDKEKRRNTDNEKELSAGKLVFVEEKQGEGEVEEKFNWRLTFT